MSSETFERAVSFVGQFSTPTSNETKLRLYALYKIATVSRVPTSERPGLWDFAGRAKWTAWARLGQSDEYAALTEEEEEEGVRDRARTVYIDEARQLGFRAQDEETSKAGEGAEDGAGRGKAKTDRMVAVSTLEDSFVDEAPPSRIHELAIKGDVAALERFLHGEGQGTDLNERDSYGYTPLHLATDRGHAKLVKVLLAYGADRSLTDEDGNTALDLARLAEHVEVIALLS